MDTFPLDNTTYNADDLGMWFATRTSGVLSTGTNLAVSAPGNMTVTVAPGLCWLKMADDWGVAARLPSTETLTIANGDSLKYRIDNIVVRLDRVLNKTVTAVVVGTLASSKVLAVPPAPARNANVYEIVIARVTVDKGITTITSGMISDTRLDANICGIVRDGITGIDTSVLQAQATAEIAKIDALLEQTVIDGLPDGSIVTAKFASNAKAPQASLADVATVANSVQWANVASKPTTFTPATHVHATTDITSGSLAVANGGTGSTTITGAMNSLRGVSLGTGNGIPVGANLDALGGVGNWYCWDDYTATTITHCPITTAFLMRGYYSHGNDAQLGQEIIEHSTGTRYYREFTSSTQTWSAWHKTHDSSTTLSVANGGTGATTLARGILFGNGTDAVTSTATLPLFFGGTGGKTATEARTSLGVSATSATVTKPTSLVCNVVASGSIVVTANNGDALIKQGLPAGPIYCCTATHYNDVSGDPNYIIATRAYSGSIWARYNSNITGVVRINYIIYKVV